MSWKPRLVGSPTGLRRTTTRTVAKPSSRYRPTKRVLDAVVALGLLVLASPIWLVCALAVRLTSRGPILFRQERIGQDGQTFTLLKFRTMTVNNDDSAHRAYVSALHAGGGPTTVDGIFKIDDDPRVTPAGSWLRRYSLDELPQLINVLKGEMSLVGPRPCLGYEWELYSPLERRRSAVLPGLTGLWQVSGRNRLSVPEMLELDLGYVDNACLRLDLKILASTPGVLWRGDGAR